MKEKPEIRLGREQSLGAQTWAWAVLWKEGWRPPANSPGVARPAHCPGEKGTNVQQGLSLEPPPGSLPTMRGWNLTKARPQKNRHTARSAVLSTCWHRIFFVCEACGILVP